MRCTECGSEKLEMDGSYRYCRLCGTVVSEVMFFA